MIIRICSDIHSEWGSYSLVDLPEDKDSIAVIAGDICGWKHGSSYVAQAMLGRMSNQFRAVVYVFGNHEYYHGADIMTFRDEIRHQLKVNDITNIHILENDTVVFDDVAFIGATLWTDFNKQDPRMMVMAPGYMADYSQIRCGDRKLKPIDVIGMHLESRKYIFDQVKYQHSIGNKAVVVTHHGVTEQSVHERYKGDPYNCNFVSELTPEIIDANPELMIHGHVHDPFDYMVQPDVCQTRVVVNPRGYVPHENNGHDLCKQVEV